MQLLQQIGPGHQLYACLLGEETSSFSSILFPDMFGSFKLICISENVFYNVIVHCSIAANSDILCIDRPGKRELSY